MPNMASNNDLHEAALPDEGETHQTAADLMLLADLTDDFNGPFRASSIVGAAQVIHLYGEPGAFSTNRNAALAYKIIGRSRNTLDEALLRITDPDVFDRFTQMLGIMGLAGTSA